MKRWIINILQYIINSIESEEDDTLPEDYLKNIVIKLEQVSKEEQKKIFKLYQMNSPMEVELKLLEK